MSDPIRLFIFGLGYTATAHRPGDAGPRRLRRRHGAQRAESGRGSPARASTPWSSTARRRARAVVKALQGATHILASIPPGERRAIRSSPIIVPISSPPPTSPGSAISPRSASTAATAAPGSPNARRPHPVRGRSTMRLSAERAWQGLGTERGLPVGIFRLAGIYGPGRNAFVKLAAGDAHRVVKPGQVFNRIHRDDIVGALAAALPPRRRASTTSPTTSRRRRRRLSPTRPV